MAFRVLWWSRAVSFTGEGVGRTALVLYAAGHGAGAVSLVLLAMALPRFFGPLAGALADRMDQRRLMAVCELGQATVFVVLAAVRVPLPVVVGLVLVTASFATAFVPAGRSAVPALVPAERLGRANALLGTALNLQLALGPTVGGLAVSLGGFRVAFLLNAVTFVVSALLLTRLPSLPPSGDHSGLLAETVAGIRFVARVPGLRALVVALFLVVSFAAIDNVALVFLVTEPTEFGFAQASYGVGMLVASVALSLVPGQRWVLAGGFGFVVAGFLGTAVAPALWAVVVAQVVGGMGNGMENVATDTLVQRLAPRAMLGRVFGAVATAAQLGVAVAAAIGGPLVALVGPRWTFGIAGAGCLVALFVAVPAFRVPSVR